MNKTTRDIMKLLHVSADVALSVQSNIDQRNALDYSECTARQFAREVRATHARLMDEIKHAINGMTISAKHSKRGKLVSVATTRKRKRASVARDCAASVVATPHDAARRALPFMREEQETFVAIYLDIRNGMMGEPFVCAIGTVCGVEVHPRDVFREAVRRNAVACVVLHNHPTGDVTPSGEDIALTRRLQSVGQLLGVPLIDHVVVSTKSGGSFSIAENFSGEL